MMTKKRMTLMMSQLRKRRRGMSLLCRTWRGAGGSRPRHLRDHSAGASSAIGTCGRASVALVGAIVSAA